MQRKKLIFYIQYLDGESEAQKVSCTQGIKMLKEIMLKKSKIQYAALIKEQDNGN